MGNGMHLRGKGKGFGTNCPLALFKGDHRRKEQVQNCQCLEFYILHEQIHVHVHLKSQEEYKPSC